MLTAFDNSNPKQTTDKDWGLHNYFKDEVRLEPCIFTNQKYDVLKIDNCIVDSLIIKGCKIGRLIIKDAKVRGSIDIMNSAIDFIELQGNFAQAINIDVGYTLKNLQVDNNQCQLNFKNSADYHSAISINNDAIQHKSLIDSSLFVKG